MSSQSDVNMLNTIRIVIREELADIRTSVARINENVANQQQFIRQTFNADRTSNAHRDVVEQSAIKRRMSYLVSHSDDRSVRHIPATMNEAHMGFIPRRTNKTPSATARINALINYLWKKQKGTDVNISALEQKLICLQFHMYIRQCWCIIKDDGVVEVNWGKLNSQKKLYYSLRLVELIFNNYNFPLYDCQDQWAASLLLQEVMKAERQTEKRRKYFFEVYVLYLQYQSKVLKTFKLLSCELLTFCGGLLFLID
ncbi:hypothetical protein F4703DRAFT_1794838 [Phycomyces blakesleeanus]